MGKFKLLKLLGFISSILTITSCWDDNPMEDDGENLKSYLWNENEDLDDNKDIQTISESNILGNEVYSLPDQTDDVDENIYTKSYPAVPPAMKENPDLKWESWTDALEKLKGLEKEKNNFQNEIFTLRKDKSWGLVSDKYGSFYSNAEAKCIGEVLSYILKLGGKIEFNEKSFSDQNSSVIIVWCLKFYNCDIFNGISFSDNAKLGLTSAKTANTICIEGIGDCNFADFCSFCQIIRKLNLQKNVDFSTMINDTENNKTTKFGGVDVSNFAKDEPEIEQTCCGLNLFLQPNSQNLVVYENYIVFEIPTTVQVYFGSFNTENANDLAKNE